MLEWFDRVGYDVDIPSLDLVSGQQAWRSGPPRLAGRKAALDQALAVADTILRILKAARLSIRRRR